MARTALMHVARIEFCSLAQGWITLILGCVNALIYKD
ncbi:hypothetical protein BofuT4_uP044970.1 [Botrytis cinerea T4]|uniref:Uncharacterized protein n=1 Tax=Botryotinia fuckeliana (strain T4) TaxID=999810 RepID=G2XYE2_BOTF4|nr:hypothetical protein BofuT4_uP044970.1 [Botrytis cinerea T4]